MAKVQHRGIEEARKDLGAIVTAAEEGQVQTVLTRHGKPKAVVVPMDDFRRYRELDGDPTDL